MADIVISEYIDPVGIDILKDKYDVLYDQELYLDPDRLASVMPGAKALIVRFQTQARGKVLEAGDALKCVGRLGVGLDNIDVDACREKGIEVFPAVGANSDSVAELAVGGLYVMFRQAYHVTEETVAGGWPRPRIMGREVMGKTLGILGFGSIGRALAWRANGIGMKVLAWDPIVPAEASVWEEAGVERVADLGEVLDRADAVSLHVPLVDDTRDLIGAAELKRMKSDAVLINLARGGIVNEPELAEALKAGEIAGAFLDAFVEEPLPANSVFAGVPNLMLTPHAGARTVESDYRVCSMIAEAVDGCLSK